MSHVIGTVVPGIEEIAFRVILQGVLLTKIPKIILGRMSPKKVGLVDCKMARVFRVIVTASAFAAFHGIGELYSPTYQKYQILSAALLGVFLSAIYETRLGCWAPMDSIVPGIKCLQSRCHFKFRDRGR